MDDEKRMKMLHRFFKIFICLVLIFSVLSIHAKTDVYEENPSVITSSMFRKTFSSDINFNRSLLLAATQEDYISAINLAAKYQIPLILVSRPYHRIEYFVDLYKPANIYEVGDTPFDAISLTEDDLRVDDCEKYNDYVVIAKKDGEFSIVGKYLASLHRGKIIYADTLDDKQILEELQKINPIHCALVWNPDDITCTIFEEIHMFMQVALSQSTLSTFIQDTLTKIDDDPYIDVSFGFVTGSDVTDANLLLAREMIIGEIAGDWKNNTVFAPGVSSDIFCKEVGLQYIGLSKENYSAHKFLERIVNGVGYASFVGHGYPLGLSFSTSQASNNQNKSYLVSCPREHQRLLDEGWGSVYIPNNLTCPPTIYLMEACFSGLTGNLFHSITGNQYYDCDDFRNHSLPLKLIRSGAVAFIGSTAFGGINTWAPHMFGLAYKWSLGEIATHINNCFISHYLKIKAIPITVYNYAPRVTVFGDPSFIPFFPEETSHKDFYRVDTNESTFFGVPQTRSVSVKHLKEFDFSFGKIEIKRDKADTFKAMKMCNSFLCVNRIYHLNERVSEESINFRVEENHDKIFLSWFASYPDLANNTLTMVITNERPYVCIIED